MKKFIATLGLMIASSTAMAECFNASEIAAQAPSPFAAAPKIEQALVNAGAAIGWKVDQASANSAAYQIIGTIGVTAGDSVEVCVLLDSSGGLAYQAYASQAGAANAGFMPLVGSAR